MATEFDETQRFEAVDLPRLAPGVTLAGRYTLEKELGRGGMGVVFKARDRELERTVAIKLLPAAAASKTAAERLVREARAAAALNHPAVVAVYDVGDHGGIPFFVMELVEGPNLHEAAPAELSEIVRIGMRICDALEHAHAHGVVHRDLKPDNVLLTGTATSRQIKLADLGVAARATASQRVTDSGAIVGTVSYMAPEQAMGETVDGRADLYALGVVLYELVTGRLPFTGARPLEVVSQHVHAPVVPPRSIRPLVPAALDAVIVRLLAKQPAQRFASAAEVREALAASLTRPDEGDGGGTGATVAILDALARGRLVGRVEELQEARELWRRAREGANHCLLISGEPGAGKTRLARELLIQAALDGALVMTGACYEYEAATPYLPFAEAFRRLVRDEPDDGRLRALLGDAASRIARLAPEIDTRLGPFSDRPELSPHEERLLFADTVAVVIRSAASARSVLFYIDDLHWADASSLWLMGRLLRGLHGERVLFCASYREMELDRAHPLSGALVEWNRERLTTRIALKRFGPAQTREQIAALLAESIGKEFADAVYRETEGNPFFVEEVVKALIESGSVRREGGRWVWDEVANLSIPQSVKAAIGHRLDRIAPECAEVLRAAAVLGKTFEFKELLAIAGDRGEDALLDAVDEAVSAQLLSAGREESFSFTHDKIREVLYEELNPIRRRRLHLRTANGLERVREESRVPAEKLAHHFHEAGEHDRGLFWAKRAGADALGLFAYDEAIAAYGRALECAQALGREDEELALEESIGKTHIISGNFVEAASHFERALALTDDPAARATLQCQAASSLVAVGDPRGLEYVRRALEVLDPDAHPIETANALMIEARFHHLSGQHRKAAEILARAQALAAPPADGSPLPTLHASTLTQILAYSAGAYQHLGLLADADRIARTAIEFGKAHNILLAQAVGHEFLGENACTTGEWKAALGYAVIERELAGRLHSRERATWTHLYEGLSLVMLDEPEKAAGVFAAGLELAETIGERRAALLMHTYLALAQANGGDFETAEKTADAAAERADAAHLLYMRTEARRVLGELRLRRGRLEEAIGIFEDILRLTEGTDARVSRLWIGPMHVDALVKASRIDEARERLRDYAALVAECQSPYFSNEAERLRKELSTAPPPTR